MTEAGAATNTGAGAGRAAGGPVHVLTYHSLDESGSVISVAPAAFRRQMEGLHARGYEGVTLGRLIDAWDHGTPLPPRPVVLTFDDAFGNFADHAEPVLTRLGFRATLFAVAGYCGGRNDWPGQPAGVPRLPLLSWAALRDLAAGGYEVGGHTLTHPPLPALPPDRAEHEVVAGRAELRDRLGREIDTFAYPYGLADARTRAVVAAEFRAACGVRLGTARPSSDRFRLPRVDVFYLRRPLAFRLFPGPAGDLYLKLRGVGRACRGLVRGGTGPAVPAETNP